MADLNTGDIIDSPALRPTMVYVTAGPHKGKRGKVRSASGDGHVLVDTPGQKQPIRVNKDHITSADGNDMLRAMATNRRNRGASPC